MKNFHQNLRQKVYNLKPLVSIEKQQNFTADMASDIAKRRKNKDLFVEGGAGLIDLKILNIWTEYVLKCLKFVIDAVL